MQKIKPSSQNAYMTGIINYSWGRILAEVLRKIFGRKRDMTTADERKLHMMSFKICTLHQTNVQINNNKTGRAGSKYGEEVRYIYGFGVET